jgi:hypothetical protein
LFGQQCDTGYIYCCHAWFGQQSDTFSMVMFSWDNKAQHL